MPGNRYVAFISWFIKSISCTRRIYKAQERIYTEYAPLPQNGKTRIRKFVLNFPVDPQSYEFVSIFKASIKLVEKARSIERLIDSTRNHCNKSNLDNR